MAKVIKSIPDDLVYVKGSVAKTMVGASKTDTLISYCRKFGMRMIMPSPRKIAVSLADLKRFQEARQI